MNRDVYAEVSDRIIAQLESGCAPWERPWTAGESGAIPTNYATGRAYRGANILLLWSSGFGDQRWMTYKQAQAVGGQVRKGEHATPAVFFKPWQLRELVDGETDLRTVPVLKSFALFNVAQIDGLPESAPITLPSTPAADMLSLAALTHGGDRAFYSPTQDAIRLPQPSQFKSLDAYFATGLHELTHWTGHASRCGREFGKRFGDSAYAVEELVAEMGAAFLCASAGMGYSTLHADYLAHWISVLRDDKRAVFHAASKAQAAADFVLAAIGQSAVGGDEEAVLCA